MEVEDELKLKWCFAKGCLASTVFRPEHRRLSDEKVSPAALHLRFRPNSRFSFLTARARSDQYRTFEYSNCFTTTNDRQRLSFKSTWKVCHAFASSWNNKWRTCKRSLLGLQQEKSVHVSFIRIIVNTTLLFSWHCSIADTICKEEISWRRTTKKKTQKADTCEQEAPHAEVCARKVSAQSFDYPQQKNQVTSRSYIVGEWKSDREKTDAVIIKLETYTRDKRTPELLRYSLWWKNCTFWVITADRER